MTTTRRRTTLDDVTDFTDDITHEPRMHGEKREQALAEEARRLCERYIREIVLPFGLCPWAEPALVAGRVEISVITDDFSDDDGLTRAAEATRATLDELADSVDLALVVLPRWHRCRLDMDSLLRIFRSLPSRLSARTAPQRTPSHDGSERNFAVAAFHPDAPPDSSDPERFIPYLRRSPDPLVQAVRNEVLRAVDSGRGSGTAFLSIADLTSTMSSSGFRQQKSLRARIAESNWKTVQKDGGRSFEAAVADILLDRDETYRRILGPK